MAIAAGVCTIDLQHVHELLCQRLDCRLSSFSANVVSLTVRLQIQQ